MGIVLSCRCEFVNTTARICYIYFYNQKYEFDLFEISVCAVMEDDVYLVLPLPPMLWVFFLLLLLVRLLLLLSTIFHIAVCSRSLVNAIVCMTKSIFTVFELLHGRSRCWRIKIHCYDVLPAYIIHANKNLFFYERQSLFGFMRARTESHVKKYT